jgi:predicted MFS family arabinose efflux permease
LEHNIKSISSKNVPPEDKIVPIKLRRSIVVISIFALCIDALAVRSSSLLAPFIRDALQLNDRQIGYVIAALVAGTLVIVLPAGRILELVNTHRIFPIIMIAVGMAFLWITLQQTFMGLLSALFILGLLRAGIIPLVNRVIAKYISPNQRGRILGFVYAAVPLGGFLGAVGLPALAKLINWNTSYLILGIITLLGGLLIWILAPKDSINRPTIQPKSGMSSLFTFPFIILSAAYTLFAFSMMGEVFVTLYLVDVVKISALLAGIFFGLIQLTGMGGRVLWGILADRHFSTNRWSLLAMTSGLTVVSYGLMMELNPASAWWMITGTMVLLGLSVASSWVILSALVGDVVGIDRVTIATATIFFLTNITDVLGPVTYGNLLDQTHSYQITLGLFMGVATISAVIFTWMAHWNKHHRSASIDKY